MRTTRLEFTLPDWPDELDGTRIALLSDFHLGRFGTSERVIARAIAEAERFHPDLTILAGDYVDSPFSPGRIEPLRPLADHSRLVAVLGNHDYVRGREHQVMTEEFLASLGANVLRNEAREIKLSGDSVWVVGLDDPFTMRSDIKRARAQLPEDAGPVLLAAHAPVLSALGDLDSVALVLCGHTHGGQIRLLSSGDVPGKPILRWIVGESGPRQDPDLHRGVHQIDTTPIVISDGLGVSLLPIRFRTRPEVVLITLRARDR